MDSVLLSHNSDEWYTPQDFYDNLNDEFSFTLDPCSTDSNCKCAKHYTAADNGLLKSWAGETVFCNPPYSDIKAWVKKCYEESLSGNTTVVLLIPSRTDTSYFHDYILGKAEIRFIRGRLKFGGVKKGAPFPSLVAVYRK